jgi:hypothetical protein
MTRLRIDELNPGMVVAGDVCDRSGRLLLSAGSPLHERHLAVFRSWGVCTVEVASPGEPREDPPEPVTLDPELRAEVEQSVARRFHHTDRKHPAIGTLFELCVQRLARKQMRREADGVL